MGFKVEIGANTQQLVAGLKDAEVKLKQFEGKADAAMSRAGRAAGKAGTDFSKFNRIIQDSPYGIMGITNNLQELIPNMGLLSIGINAALAAVTFAQVGFSYWTRGLGENKKAVDAASLSGEDYVKTLDQLSAARLSGAQSSAGELTTLKLLFDQYTNNTLGLAQRKSAYKQLQEIYPAYFGNLQFEAKATDKTTNAYKKLTAEIIASANARAASSLLEENSKRELQNKRKLITLNEAAARNQANLDKLGERVKGAGGELNEASALADYTAALQQQGAIQREINNLVSDNNKLTANNLLLIKEVTKETANGGLLTGGIGGDPAKAAKDVKTVADVMKALNTDLRQVNESVLSTFGEKSQDRVKAFAKAIDELISIGVKPTDSVIQGLKDRILTTAPKELPFAKMRPAIDGLGTFVDQYNKTNDLVKRDPIIPFPPAVAAKMVVPFQDLGTYLQDNLLPQMQGTFQTFFDDLLMHGEISFKTLGESIKKTFASVLANEATTGLMSLISNGGKGGGLLQAAGLFKKGAGVAGAVGAAGAVAGGAGSLASVAASTGGFLGLGAGLGAGGTGALVAGTAATGGVLLPILAGVAAIAGLATLFKKKKDPEKPASAPTATNYAPSTSGVNNLNGGEVVFRINGQTLVGVLTNTLGANQRIIGTP